MKDLGLFYIGPFIAHLGLINDNYLSFKLQETMHIIWNFVESVLDTMTICD